MKDYDDLARFRRKSGNAHFELRPVSGPSLPRGRAEQAALPAVGPRGVVVTDNAAARAPAQPALSLGAVAQEQEMRARRARLAGLFRRPEPSPSGPVASSGTLLKPLLRRIAEQSRRT